MFVNMRLVKRTCRTPVLVIFLILSFSLITANEQVDNPTVCSPRNPDCYFERFGSLTLPRIDPIQASMIAFIYLQALNQAVINH